MSCNSLDLTIDSAMSDPMIAAVMRADGIEAWRFEDLLRSTARDIDGPRRPGPMLPLAALADRLRGAVAGCRPR